jgi:hypothetical protein
LSGRFRSAVLPLIGAFFLGGCAAQTVTPVAMVQPGDDQLGCRAIIEQLKANRADADEFLRKNKQVEQDNTAKIVVGSVLPVGLLLMASVDLSNSEQIKARAIIDRNQQLEFMAKQRGCTE